MRRKKTASVRSTASWKRKKATTRKKAARRAPRGVGRVLASVIAVTLLVQFVAKPAIGHITAHPIFTVRNVVVDGAEYLDAGKIRAVADEAVGANIFEVDVAAISEELGNLYEAEEFTVYKSLPSSITIRIHERQPVALLSIDSLVGVDRNGVPLPHVGADMVAVLPIVTGIKSVADLADSTTRARLVKGLKLLDGISDMAPSTYRRISEVDVSSLNTLGVSLVDGGLEVIIGENDWLRKLPVLDRVIAEVTYRKDEVKAVDIRLGETIFVQ